MGKKVITEQEIKVGGEHITYAQEGSIVIRGNINELKQYVEDVNEAVEGSGNELPNSITDMFYSIESEYQAYYGLHHDNWDTVKAGDEVEEFDPEEG